MKTVVVLGGADGSVGVYQKVREFGYRTICVDVRPDAPGVRFADEYVAASVRAPEEVAAALLDRDDIVGVVCPANDIGLPAQAWLGRHWDLPNPLPGKAVAASNDKSVFREVCARLGLPSYRSVAGTAGPELVASAARLRFPTLVKPVDASGSRGVVACATPDRLAEVVAESAAFSPTGRVVVEEHVDGTPLAIEVLVVAGAVAFHAVTERTITPPPFFVTTSHLMHAVLPDEVDRRLVVMLEAICADLGYTHGPLTLDAVLTPEGELYLIEMGTRMGGNGLAEVVESCHGVDLVAATVACAVGHEVVLAPHPPRPAMVHVLASDRGGLLLGIDGTAEVLALPELVELKLFAEAGSRVRPYEQAGYKLGYAVLAADTVAELYAVRDRVRDTLKFRLDEPDVLVSLP